MTPSKNGTRPYSPTLDKLSKASKVESRVISWEVLEPAVLWALVVAVNDAKGAVLFGGTVDRGAWAITIFHDGLPKGKKTEYCNSEEHLGDFVRGLTELWADVASELDAAQTE